MFAAVDLGSNSFRLHIGQYDGRTMHIVRSARDPIRLGAGLNSQGCLTEPAMQRALECLRQFNSMLSMYSLDAVRIVATNTMRIAKNVNVFLPAAEKAIGYPIEIISGEEEARLIYIGVASTLATADETRLVVDIGGGSTELILGRGQDIQRVESLNIGTVKQSLSFFPGGRIDAGSFNAATLSARSHFEDAALPYQAQYWTTAYGSSGTIRAIAEAIAKNQIGDGTLSYSNMEALKARLITFGHTDRIVLAGIKPERAPIMVGGVAILMGLMQELGMQALSPIDAGLRMGVLWDFHLCATQRDRREQSILDCLLRFHIDETRAHRVAAIASTLYQLLKPTCDTHQRHLHWSALLHEVGRVISQNDYHKHGAYLIENADLPGFTTREQSAMSKLILGQKGNLRKINGALANLDFAKAILALRLAVMLMHSKIDIDPTNIRLKMKNKIDLEIARDYIANHPTFSYWIEKEKECWNQVGVDFSIKIN